MISWTWSRSEGRAFVVLGIFFFLVMLVPFFTTDRNGEPTPVAAKIFLLSFITLCSVPLIVGGLLHMVNRTQLTVTRASVVRRNLPLWPDQEPFEADGVKQFFVAFGRAERNSAGFARLYIIDRRDHAHMIASKLPNRIAAHQIVHELQDFYGLEDLPVYGQTTDPWHPGPRA